MMVNRVELIEEGVNPLDSVEEMLCDNNWIYSRTDDNCLTVQVKGKTCNYQLSFLWQRNLSALQFTCKFIDLAVKPDNMAMAAASLIDMNEETWMGHFEISKGDLKPSYRQTCLMKGYSISDDNEYFEDLIDISLAHCERYYPVFHILSKESNANSENLSLALMETAGES